MVISDKEVRKAVLFGLRMFFENITYSNPTTADDRPTVLGNLEIRAGVEAVAAAGYYVDSHELFQ